MVDRPEQRAMARAEGTAEVEWLLTEDPDGAFTLLSADGTSIGLQPE